MAAFLNDHWRLDRLLAEGEWISARFTDSGTWRGVFLGVAPTGRSVSTFELEIYRLQRRSKRLIAWLLQERRCSGLFEERAVSLKVTHALIDGKIAEV